MILLTRSQHKAIGNPQQKPEGMSSPLRCTVLHRTGHRSWDFTHRSIESCTLQVQWRAVWIQSICRVSLESFPRKLSDCQTPKDIRTCGVKIKCGKWAMPAMQSWGKFIFIDASTCPWQKLVTQDMDSERAWPPGLTFARLPVHLVEPYQAFVSAQKTERFKTAQTT